MGAAAKERRYICRPGWFETCVARVEAVGCRLQVDVDGILPVLPVAPWAILGRILEDRKWSAEVGNSQAKEKAQTRPKERLEGEIKIGNNVCAGNDRSRHPALSQWQWRPV